MEFYLVRNGVLELPAGGTQVGIRIRRKSIPIKLDISDDINSAEESGNFYRRALVNSLTEWITVWKDWDPDNRIPTLDVSVALTSSASHLGSITVSNEDSETCILQRLRKVHGKSNVKINLTVKDFHYTGSKDHFDFETKDLPINSKEGKGALQDGCEFNQVKFPETMWAPWKAGTVFTGLMTISVTVNHNVVNNLFLDTYAKPKLLKRSKKILKDEAFCDLVITAANGTEVKCHKSFLTVSSDVFKAMFESEMKEAATNTVDMSDMTEHAVRAFLAFIYHWEVLEASKNCEIAVDLLRAGHKYAISELEAAMREILCTKPNDWFNVDVALKLLLFARNLSAEDHKEILQKKALQVIRWHTGASHDNLFNSEEFKLLFKNNLATAMEISALFITFSL